MLTFFPNSQGGSYCLAALGQRLPRTEQQHGSRPLEAAEPPLSARRSTPSGAVTSAARATKIGPSLTRQWKDLQKGRQRRLKLLPRRPVGQRFPQSPRTTHPERLTRLLVVSENTYVSTLRGLDVVHVQGWSPQGLRGRTLVSITSLRRSYNMARNRGGAQWGTWVIGGPCDSRVERLNVESWMLGTSPRFASQETPRTIHPRNGGVASRSMNWMQGQTQGTSVRDSSSDPSRRAPTIRLSWLA